MSLFDQYKCQDCGNTFEEPAIRTEKVGSSTDSLAPGYLKYEVCPCCGSEDFDEIEAYRDVKRQVF